MNYIPLLISRFLLVICPLAIALPQTTQAAAFSVVLGVPGIPITQEADTYYPGIYRGGTWDGISTIFHAPVTVSDDSFALTSNVYGRNYDSDPAKPGAWGLLNRETLTGFNEPPWLVKHGLAPEFVGSPQYFSTIDGVWTPVDASYVSFEVEMASNVGNDRILFDDLSLSITGIFNTAGDTDIWATTNYNNFSNPIKAVITIAPSEDTDVYSFSFGPASILGEKLEVRVYGILGLDQGTFGTTILSGSVNPAPVPEPTAVGLIAVGLAGVGLRRQRKARQH